MAKKNKEEYRLQNEKFLEDIAQEEGVKGLRGGILYKVLEEGSGGGSVGSRSIVTCHYKGSLINGKVFDQTQKGRPATFRLNELITGWTTALREMPVGSRWEIVIPYHLGYGSRSAGAIKAFSTLIFDITLLDAR